MRYPATRSLFEHRETKNLNPDQSLCEADLLESQISNMSRSEEHDSRNKALQQAFSSRDDAKAAGQPTAKTIQAECRKLGLPWRSEDITAAEGARLHWIGDRDATAVLLYFHGEFDEVI